MLAPCISSTESPTLSDNESIVEYIIGHVKIRRGKLVGDPAIKLKLALLGDDQRGRQRHGPKMGKEHDAEVGGDLPGETNEEKVRKGDGRSTTGREGAKDNPGNSKGASSSCTQTGGVGRLEMVPRFRGRRHAGVLRLSPIGWLNRG